LRDDLEIGHVAQAQLDPAARQPLVVDDEGPDFHACAPRAAPAGTACGFAAACGPAAADSSGSAISIRSPGWRLSTAKRWFSPKRSRSVPRYRSSASISWRSVTFFMGSWSRV